MGAVGRAGPRVHVVIRGQRAARVVATLALAVGASACGASLPAGSSSGHLSVALTPRARWVFHYRPTPRALTATPVSLVPVGTPTGTAGVSRVNVVAIMMGMSMPPVTVRLRPVGHGMFKGTVVLTMPGPWAYHLQIWRGSRRFTWIAYVNASS
jgi:hypothetical protein